jgi:hypothetical protein
VRHPAWGRKPPPENRLLLRFFNTKDFVNISGGSKFAPVTLKASIMNVVVNLGDRTAIIKTESVDDEARSKFEEMELVDGIQFVEL